MSFIELQRAVWRNKELFEDFFKGYSEAAKTLWKKAKTPLEQGNKKAWREELGEGIEALCVSWSEGEVQKNFLFVVEKAGFLPKITRCYRFYRDWETDFRAIPGKELVLRSTYYDQFTDNVEGSQLSVQKPNLAFFSQNIDGLLREERFASSAKMFEFATPLEAVLRQFPELLNKLPGFSLTKSGETGGAPGISCDGFLHRAEDIAKLGDAVSELAGGEPGAYSRKLDGMHEKLGKFAANEFWSAAYQVASLFKKCRKKKAFSKKTAVEAKYSRAWIEKTTSGKEALVIRMNNVNPYTYCFVLDSLDGGWAAFRCHRVYEDWHEGLTERPPIEHVALMNRSTIHYADFGAKPDLKSVLEKESEMEPVFALAKAGEGESSYRLRRDGAFTHELRFGNFPKQAAAAAEAANLLPWFEN